MTRGRLALTGLLVALAIWVFVYKAAPKMPDFEVYWKAAARAAHAEPLYRTDDGHFQFKYLPAFAVLAIPIGLLPLATAEIVWFATSVALLVALARDWPSRLPVERRKPVRWLVVVTVVAFGKFYAHELVLGQVNILFAVVATGALLAMKAKPRGAGRRARRPRDRHQAVRRALPALADRPAAPAVDRRGVRGPRRRPRPAGRALRRGTATSRCTASGGEP